MENIVIKDRQTVIVNSRDRVQGDDRFFSINLPLHSNNFNYVTCLQVYIPKTYYLFDTGYNTFQVDNLGDGNWTTITITPGSYNVTTLITELVARLGAAWSVTYSVSTLKFTFTRTDGGGIVKFLFNSSIFPASALGFVSSTTYLFTLSGSDYVLTAPNCLNLNLENTMLIQSDKVDGNILQEIFVANASNFTAITYENPDPILTRKKIAHKHTKFWTFEITDEDNILINSLNGQNVVMSLLFLDVDEYVFLNKRKRE